MSISKEHLLASIDQVREGLKLVEPVCDLLYSVSGDGYSLGQNQGAQQVLDTLAQVIHDGFYDEDDGGFDIELVLFTEEDDLDTNPEESYPEEDGQQDEDVGNGIVILDPHTTPEERAELVEFYNSIGIKVQ